MAGFLDFLENLSPGQVQALASGGAALSALGSPYMDPTEPGRGFRQALLEAPGRIQQAEQGALQQRLGEQQFKAQEAALAQQQQQQAASQGLRDFIMGARRPGAGAQQAASPAMAPDAFAGAPSGGRQMSPDLMQLVASAYPELFAQQFLGQAFAPPTAPKRYTVGEGQTLVDESGRVVAEGREKTEKPTNLVKNLKAADIDPMSPEGRDLITKNLTRAGTSVTIKEGEKKAAFYLSRMKVASDRIGQLEAGGYSPTAIGELMRSLGGNWLRSSEGQRYSAAAREWTAPILRYESGAEIPDKEFENFYQIYFPVAGDSQETILQKAQARRDLESAMLGIYGSTAEKLGALPGQKTPGSTPQAAPQTPQAAPQTANEYKRKYPFLK